MTKGSRFEGWAEEAAERIRKSEGMAQQLTLLPGEDAAEAEAGTKGRGVAKRRKGLGAWLRVQGYRDPAEVLAELAGLNTDLDAITAAVARAEQAMQGLGIEGEQARVALFQTFFAASIRANEALMPYLHAKAAAEAPPPPAVQVFVSQPSSQAPGDGAKLVNPAPAAPGVGLRFAPPPMPGEIEQNQEDSE